MWPICAQQQNRQKQKCAVTAHELQAAARGTGLGGGLLGHGLWGDLAGRRGAVPMASVEVGMGVRMAVIVVDVAMHAVYVPVAAGGGIVAAAAETCGK